MLKAYFKTTIKTEIISLFLLRLKICLILSYLSVTIMLFSCLYFYESSNLILFIVKGLFFNLYISIYFLIKVVFMSIKIFILCLLKSIRVVLDDILLRIGVFAININENVIEDTMWDESIIIEIYNIINDILLIIENFSKLFDWEKINFSSFRKAVETIIYLIDGIGTNILDEIIYFLNGWSDLTVIVWVDYIYSFFLHSYLKNMKELMLDPIFGELKIFQILFNKYQIVLNNTFIVILVLQIILVIYYQIFKNLNYTKVINTISAMLFIQVHITILLYALNCNFGIITPWSVNNQFDLIEVFCIKLDKLAFTFIFTVYLIGFFVHIYQFLYLHDTPNKERFLSSINIFIISMLLIVFSSNWLLLLLAWEILGQSSFFLISFFKNKPSAFKSGYKAFFFNKISDITLIIAFVLYFKIFQRLDFLNITDLTINLKYVGVLILITAFVKSAQFFFYFWLPDSMEAPVPASALIHSATLVSAGIYLSLRFIQFIECNELAELALLISAPITMILASAMALNQTDIKRLLAYSTISNCAFIYFILLSKNYDLTQFYFVIHGILKSLSFLIAGFLIQQQNHNQDFRNWELKNKNEIFAVIVLALSLISLATLPMTLVYNIKNNINAFNTYSTKTTLYLLVTLLVYSINSYMYGLKIIITLLNRKFYLIKTKKQTPPNFKSAFNVTKIVMVYYIYILIIIGVLYYFLQIKINTFINLQWVIMIVLTTVSLLYISTQNNKLIMILLVATIVLVSLLLI